MSLTSNFNALADWLETVGRYERRYVHETIYNRDLPLLFPAADGAPVAFIGKCMLYAARYRICHGSWSHLQITVGGQQFSAAQIDRWNKLDAYERIIELAVADDSRRRNHTVLSDRDRELALNEVIQLDVPLRRQLPQGTLRHIHPRFRNAKLVGGADAGFIVDHTLWHTRTVTKGLTLPNVEQSLLYALLDYDDAYQIKALGFILPRQGARIEFEIGALFQGRPLAELRTQFLTYLQSEAFL